MSENSDQIKTTVSIREIQRRLRPLIRELTTQGRRNYATVDITTIASVASRLDEVVREWQTR